MYSLIIPLSDHSLYSVHNMITFIMFFAWVVVCVSGYYLKNLNYKKNITIFLISFSIAQELFDYINRFFLNELYIGSIQTDLPL